MGINLHEVGCRCKKCRQENHNHEQDYFLPAAASAGLGMALKAAGLAYSILNKASGDITYSIVQLKDTIHPKDNKRRYKELNMSRSRPITVGLYSTFSFGRRMGASFSVEFFFNGYSVGPVMIDYKNSEDILGWKLNITADSFMIPSNTSVQQIEIRFTYRFSSPIYDDRVLRKTLTLRGDGSHQQYNY